MGGEARIRTVVERLFEAKVNEFPVRFAGLVQPVEIHYRNNRKVHGLKIPCLLEVRVGCTSSFKNEVHQMLLEKIVHDEAEVKTSLAPLSCTKADLEAGADGKHKARPARGSSV